MRQIQLMLFVFAFVAAREATAGQGWISLFNGKDLSGWVQRAGDANFFVADGCIVGQAVSESDTNSVLGTVTNYGDFVLELDFKVDRQLFSGVHIRGHYATNDTTWQWGGLPPAVVPAGRVYGYLVLIDPSPNHRWWTATLFDQRWWTGGVYDELRRLWLYPGPEGGDPDAFSRQGRKIFRTNHWNHLRIEAAGVAIRTWLNGIPRANLQDPMDADGFIGLQVRDWISDDDHQTLEGAQVRFKHIRLKPLPPPPAHPAR
jgi:hypothetical protein